MSKTQQTAGEKPRIGEQEVRRAAELLKKYRQGKVNLERRIIDNEQFWKLRHWPQMEKTGEGGNPGDPQPTSGWLVNCILSKHADAMDCYPEPTVLPREPGDRAEAAKLTRILPAILKKNQFKRTYSSAWWYKLKSGCAVYTDFSELTTPMINEFVEKIIVHAPEKIDGDRVQEVDIHLRFIGQFELPAPELTEEEIKRQEQLKRHRIKSRERYQKIKAGEHAVGQPFMLTCKCCGQEFASKRTNTLFCGPNCRSKFYRQEAAESRSRECTCENCGKVFTTTRSDVKYCGDDCRYQAQIKRQGVRKKALRGAKIEPAVPEKETKTA